MPSTYVDHALALDGRELATALSEVPEDQWFDRKSARVDPRHLAVPLIAMANAEGGVVVVGATDDGGYDAADTPTDKYNAWRQTPLQFTSPPVRCRFEERTAVDHDGHSHTLLIIRVEPGEQVHEHADGTCYLRVGDQSRKLTFLQRQELHYDRGTAKFDGQELTDTSVADLDEDQVREYVDAIDARYTANDLLRARGLLTRDDHLTVAGYLLFASHPQAQLPHAHVRVLRYRSTERGTGSRMEVDASADVRVEGSLSRMIFEAADLVDEWIPSRRALATSGRFESVPIVPRDVWLEGIVNAVTHRSYSLAGDHIRVEIFPNRLEIESPGRFPGLVDPERPLEIDRYARNPRIARVLADLHVTRELGEGIRRMFEEMESRGLADPVYRQTPSSVRLVLRADPRIEPAVRRRLPRGSTALLDVLRSAGRPMSTGEVAEAAGLSRPTVLKRLTALRKERLIEWDGKSAKDPRASWSVRTPGAS